VHVIVIRMRRLVLVALLAAGCGGPGDEFVCDGDALCRLEGVQGTCEVDRHCSFPDDSCSYQRRWGHFSGALSDLCFGSVPLQINGAAILGSTWFGQEQTTWDAPAAVRIAISTRKTDPPSQATLAGEMNVTTGLEGTNPVSTALNKHLAPPAPAYGTVAIMGNDATVAEQNALRSEIAANIGNGYPIVCTVQSGFRPPGYPSGMIVHHVAVVGVRKNGDEVLISDPGASGKNGPGFENVARSYWIATRSLAMWVAGWGYATRR
jgi:hypothetical protein